MKKVITTEDSLTTFKRKAALASIWDLIFSGANARFKDQLADVKAWHIDSKLGNELSYKILKTGITSKVITPVGELLGLNKTLFASYLDLDRGTVARLAAKNQTLPTYAAENILRLLELNAQAAETFASEKEAFAWLNRPHPMLEGDSPLAAARTSYGTQRVKDMLLAIQYGGVV